MFDGIRQRLARIIWPAAGSQRMYASARASRVAPMGSASSSADQELVTSLRSLRSHSRQLCRDASFAKRAKVVVVNNVIGSGIGLQSQVKTTRGEPNKLVNDAIEEAFEAWSCAENCHTGGGMHFHDLERALMSEVFEAGEAFIRLHYSAFGDSKVPAGARARRGRAHRRRGAAGPGGAAEHGTPGRGGRRILPAAALLDPRASPGNEYSLMSPRDGSLPAGAGERNHPPAHR
jgi:hypothetical protein